MGKPVAYEGLPPMVFTWSNKNLMWLYSREHMAMRVCNFAKNLPCSGSLL